MPTAAMPVMLISLACAVVAADSAPRIVDCSAQVRSAKRGVCANQLAAADFTALSPGVSWWYNWHFDPGTQAPAEAKMEYLPMVWGDDPACLAGVEALLTAGVRPRRILEINEPNLKGQAFVTPAVAARLHARVRAVADRYGITVAGPNMALGSAPGDSITAPDPIEGKELTYTYMVPYLKAFLHHAGARNVTELGVHCYGNIGELSWLVGMLGTDFSKPVWVTEFNLDGGSDPAVVREHLIQATDLLERTPHIAGYAWFKERLGPQSLLAQEPGVLTALGRTYIDMPVHDADLFYRIPGRLEAERYVGMRGFALRSTRDGDGFLDMVADGGFAWIDYNIAVERAGEYVVSARIGGEVVGELQLESGDAVLGSIPCPAGEWREMACVVRLSAGTQRVRVRATRGLSLNWLRFAVR
jgi:hypothetical protein